MGARLMPRLRVVVAAVVGVGAFLLFVYGRGYPAGLAIWVGLAASGLAYFVFHTGDKLRDLYRR